MDHAGVVRYGPVSRRSPQPIYVQVLAALEQQIASGTLPPDAAVPSERALSERFGISRTTVRQAIGEGIKRGLLYRIDGRGAFVSGRAIRQEMERVVRFPDSVRQTGASPRTQVLRRDTELADVSTAKNLEIEPGSPVIRLQLLGLGDDEPLAIYDVVLREDVGRLVADEAARLAASGTGFSLYDLYERFGYPPEMIDQTLEAASAEPATAKLLQVAEGAPVCKLTSITYTAESVPVELRQATYRGDRYRFTLRRRAR